MADIKTVQRIDVTMSLEAEEAKALNEHLQATTSEGTNNMVLSVAQALSNAVNPPQRKPKDPNAPKQVRKSKEQKAAEAAAEAAKQQATTQAPAAPANTQAPKATGNAAATPAPVAEKKKVTVPA